MVCCDRLPCWTFVARIVTSYFKEANLASLFFLSETGVDFWADKFHLQTCAMQFSSFVPSIYWNNCRKFDMLSCLAFLKLSISFNSLLNMFLNDKKLKTGPLLFHLKLVVFKFGFSLRNSDHHWTHGHFWVEILLSICLWTSGSVIRSPHMSK